MENPRPYVTAALLCEKVLQEKDESLTIVRIADRIQYHLETPKNVPRELVKDAKPLVTIQGLVSLKSGPITGDHTIKIVAERPSGERINAYALPVKFLGKDQGSNIILKMGIGVTEDGLYWFDVLFDDELLTRIPVIITPLQEPKSGEQ